MKDRLAYLKENRKLFFTAIGISVVCFTSLKLVYPLPDMFPDSLSYILWAKSEEVVQFRPVGYSRFLAYIHYFISESPMAVSAFQYLLFMISGLFCLFSVDYLFKLPVKAKWILMVLLMFNPILIFQTNLIASDSLFCSLSVMWITCCFWIVKQEKWWALALQIVLLYLAFQVRYTALFYPFIAVTALLFFTRRIGYKIVGVLLTFGIILAAKSRQEQAVYDVTGEKVFSGFSGWQLANNVLYYYKKIHVDTMKFPTGEMRLLDQAVRYHYDSVDKGPGIGSAFMWSRRSPLKRFNMYYVKRYKSSYFPMWFKVSVLYQDYAVNLIKQDPGAFLKYYMYPNTLNYFYPETEQLRSYDADRLMLDTSSASWFSLERRRLYTTVPGLQDDVITLYPALSLLLNLLNIGAILVFVVRLVKNWRRVPGNVKGLFVTWTMYFFGYMAFSIFATVVTLRYMDPLYILGFVMPVILLLYKPGEAQPEPEPEPVKAVPQPAVAAKPQRKQKRK
ncbi:MAG: hypothetical protein KF744_01635 [Taibaiella sp.]|nr:hypothetical protein [Taibaiella sp.]